MSGGRGQGRPRGSRGVEEVAVMVEDMAVMVMDLEPKVEDVEVWVVDREMSLSQSLEFDGVEAGHLAVEDVEEMDANDSDNNVEDLSGQLHQPKHSAAGSSSTVNDNGPQPGCSPHWPERTLVLSDGGNQVTPRVGEKSMAQRLEAEEESDPGDDPGDLGEGHELSDIEDDHDISDEECMMYQ